MVSAAAGSALDGEGGGAGLGLGAGDALHGDGGHRESGVLPRCGAGHKVARGGRQVF